MTLRIRITLLTLALLTFSLLLIGGSVYGSLQWILYSTLRSELSDVANNAVRMLQEKGSIQDLPASVYGQAEIVVSIDGNKPSYKTLNTIILDQTPSMAFSQMRLSEKSYNQLSSSGTGLFSSIDLAQSRSKLPLLVLSRYLNTSAALPNGTFQGSLILMIGKPLEPIQTTLRGFLRAYTATALLVLIFGGFLAYRQVRSTMEPLEWVARRAEEMGNKPDKLPELSGNDEAASLVNSLNRMLSRLDSAWDTQSRFLADASHELRTPVTSILGHVGYLLRRTSVTDQQRESLEIVKREGERMQKLVGDLLELSKTGGSWKIELGAVHLATTLWEIQADYQKTLEARHETGQIQVEAPDSLWVLGDPDRLHQVLANLVSNAIKAGSSHIKLVAIDLSERVVIRVEDNGEGIAQEHLPKLFERFYRVDAARDRERGGSGLGLAIVRSIVEAHGGNIWIESEPGQGSVFNISLRSAPAPQLAHAEV
jgi:two-component system, OmpR family, sensor kinase